MNRTTLRAFSLVELLTVVAIITLLISILMPALGRARELARRTACSANLKAISQGLLVYAETNKGYFPSWGQTYASFAVTGRYYNWDGAKGPGGPGINEPPCISNTRCLWTLVHCRMGDPKTFICPSDGEAGAPFAPADLNEAYDIQNRSQMSYSYQWQGPGRDPTLNNHATNYARPGWITSTRDDNKLVVLGDHTPFMKAQIPSVTARTDDDRPGPDSHRYDLAAAKPGNFGQMFAKAMDVLEVAIKDSLPDVNVMSNGAVRSLAEARQYINSANHRGEGQSYARVDGFAGFSDTPWAGAHNDNIYTVQDPQAYTRSDATSVDMLKARMIGLYDAVKTNEDSILDNWVANPLSKTNYPDSFLVP